MTNETHESLRIELLLSGWAVLAGATREERHLAARDRLLEDLAAAMIEDLRAAFPAASITHRIFGPVNFHYLAPFYLRVARDARVLFDTLPDSTTPRLPRFIRALRHLPARLLFPDRRLVNAVLDATEASACRHQPALFAALDRAPTSPFTNGVVWAIRDLIHHYGEHHPSVSGSQSGADIAALGGAIPALAERPSVPLPDDRDARIRTLDSIFQRHGWADVPVTLDAVVGLADCLMNPDGDPATLLTKRRALRLSAKEAKEQESQRA